MKLLDELLNMYQNYFKNRGPRIEELRLKWTINGVEKSAAFIFLETIYMCIYNGKLMKFTDMIKAIPDFDLDTVTIHDWAHEFREQIVYDASNPETINHLVDRIRTGGYDNRHRLGDYMMMPIGHMYHHGVIVRYGMICQNTVRVFTEGLCRDFAYHLRKKFGFEMLDIDTYFSTTTSQYSLQDQPNTSVKTFVQDSDEHVAYANSLEAQGYMTLDVHSVAVDSKGKFLDINGVHDPQSLCDIYAVMKNGKYRDLYLVTRTNIDQLLVKIQ